MCISRHFARLWRCEPPAVMTNEDCNSSMSNAVPGTGGAGPVNRRSDLPAGCLAQCRRGGVIARDTSRIDGTIFAQVRLLLIRTNTPQIHVRSARVLARI